MPPPFGSGYLVIFSGGSVPQRRFNCAAPFRERLSAISIRTVGGGHIASIVPPPFGSGYAAPAGRTVRGYDGLQLCRPLSGAVMRRGIGGGGGNGGGLQLCRPLSGAVISIPAVIAAVTVALQLCRPLSGAVMSYDRLETTAADFASIVPPPFGSGYLNGDASNRMRGCRFNCAAPFRERLSL